MEYVNKLDIDRSVHVVYVNELDIDTCVHVEYVNELDIEVYMWSMLTSLI